MGERDYTKIPGYEGLTQPSARYNYLHDLLERYQMLSKRDLAKPVGCKRREVIGDCRLCSFNGFLGGDKAVCCNWRAEANPDRAITILEFLLAKEKEGERVSEAPDAVDKCHMIARHCGLASQMGVMEEEAAELIQALSKYRRVCAKVNVADATTEAALDHVSEEMADCYVMLEQIRYLLQNHEAVDKWLNFKLDKTLGLIEKGEL